MNGNTKSIKLSEIYRRLYQKYGPQNWWPAETDFEVIVGAILTQSAAWTNVEKGINNLKRANAVNPASIREIPHSELSGLIHSCGYYNAKAEKLRVFAQWFKINYEDDLEKMFTLDTRLLREELLKVHGIGEETADSILLYAGRKPVFVIDAYTRRLCERLGLKPQGDKYSDYQKLFMDNLPHDVQMFNEFHALIVNHGKLFCKKVPQCEGCCLRGLCEMGNY